MRKTGREIEQDIYTLLKEADIVGGSVFVAGTRPFDRIGEDIVVAHLSGVDGWGGFDQVGIVTVNMHVPDIPHREAALLPNITRLRELERKMLDLIEGYRAGDYKLTTDATATMIQDEREHIIHFRLRYRYNTTTN